MVPPLAPPFSNGAAVAGTEREHSNSVPALGRRCEWRVAANATELASVSSEKSKNAPKAAGETPKAGSVASSSCLDVGWVFL